MKTKRTKTIMATAMAVVLAAGLSIPAGAAVAEPPAAGISSIREPDAMPQMDVIVIKTRTHNGVKQYRRWNETRMYWVDPYWIDC